MVRRPNKRQKSQGTPSTLPRSTRPRRLIASRDTTSPEDPRSLSERRWEAMTWGLLRLLSVREQKLLGALYNAMTEARIIRFFDPDPSSELVGRIETFCRSDILKLESLRGKTPRRSKARPVFEPDLVLAHAIIAKFLQGLPHRGGRNDAHWKLAAQKRVAHALTVINFRFPHDWPDYRERRKEVPQTFWTGIHPMRPAALALRVTAYLWRLPPATAASLLSRARRKFPDVLSPAVISMLSTLPPAR